jgi:hypothetical protein
MKEQKVKELVQRVVNMRVAEARYLVESSGIMCRVTSEDGIQYEGSAQYVPYRINLDVIDGIVREAKIG